MNETDLTSLIRLQLSAIGCVLWRNNSGAMQDKTGRVVRYGLANESKAMSAAIKSSDLIGWTSDGRFLAIEVKAPGWRYTGTPREIAQNNFIKSVLKAGGRAGFAQSMTDALHIVGDP